MESNSHGDKSGTVRRCVGWFHRITTREFIFILVVVLTEIGCNISLVTPGALQDAIMKNYHLTAVQFSLFYTLYYGPTIISNTFSGFLIDRVMGIKLSTLVYALIALLGVTLFAIGGVLSIYWLMLLGRLIFGFGNEMATGVCVYYCIFTWYRNTIANVASSLLTAGEVVGTIIIFQSGPRLIDLLKKTMPEKEALDIVIILASGSFLITGCFAVLVTYLKPKEDPNLLDAGFSTSEVTDRRATLKDIKHFPITYWLLCLLCVLCSSLISFSEFSQGMLTSSLYNLNVIDASDAVTAMTVVSVVTALPVSLSVDILGRNTWYIIVSQVIGTLAYFMLMVGANPYASMVLVGLRNSVYSSAILPMFAYPIEKHLIGSCYGIMSTTSGLSLSLGPLIVGRLIDTYGYSASLYFYFCTSVLSLICILLVWFLDKRSTGVLSMTPAQRIEYERTMEAKIISYKVEQASHADYSSISSLVKSE